MANENRQQGCLCQKYVDAISENARLAEEVARLKRREAYLEGELGRVRRKALEKPFGESTTSGQRLVKPSTPIPDDPAERRRRMGGARPGHAGHGWKDVGEPARETVLPDPEACPHCGGPLTDPPFDADESRDVIETYPVRAYVRRYRLRARYCARCARPVRTRVPGVMDGCRYSNGVIARAATEFYLNGIPIGTVSRTTGVDKGTLLAAFARVAKLLGPVRERECEIIRTSPFAQGDESGWRIDGRNGYAWVFIAGNVVVFACAGSRKAEVAKEVLGEFRGLYGCDRYKGYGFIFFRSFCLEHLKRDAIRIREENPDDAECAGYADAIVPLLAEIMKLRGEFGDDPKAYRKAATDAAGRLYALVSSPARHKGIQAHQNVFRDARLQPWQWLIGPEVPAENNRSEREVRAIARARDCSHGSQSDNGAWERGVFMSVLHTLRACGEDPSERLRAALDRKAADPDADLFDALFGGLDLAIPKLPRGPIRKLPKSVTEAKTKGRA